MTTNQAITGTGWTPVSAGEATCIVKNESGQPAYIAVADAVGDLAAVTGHLFPALSVWPFVNLGTKKVFVRRHATYTGPLNVSVSAY